MVDITVKGVRRTATCATHELAVIKRLQLEAELRAAGAQQSEDPTTDWPLSQALATSANVRWHGTRNEAKALATAQEAVVHFGPGRRLDSITTLDVDDYVATLRGRGNGPATINRKLAALSAMFSDALKRGGCSRKPCIARQSEPTHRIRYLSIEEEMQLLSLLQQWGQVGVRDAVVTLVDTGMRVGELLRCQARDVDLAANLVSIWENKGDLPRSVPMTARVRAIIEERCMRSTGPVFADLHRERLRHYWDRARLAMGLDDDRQFVPHALRHTFATRLVQRGVSLFEVQKLLGHHEISVTARYSHLSNRELHRAIDVLQGRVIPDAVRAEEMARR